MGYYEFFRVALLFGFKIDAHDGKGLWQNDDEDLVS